MAKRPASPKLTVPAVSKQIDKLVSDQIVARHKSLLSSLSKGNLDDESLTDDLIEGFDTIERNVATAIDTSLSVSSRKRLMEFAEGTGLRNFRYIGGLIKTSREFCEERNGNTYTEEEVKSWADKEWDGKIEGTDEENIFEFCGGWNCRHQLVPILTNEEL